MPPTPKTADVVCTANPRGTYSVNGHRVGTVVADLISHLKGKHIKAVRFRSELELDYFLDGELQALCRGFHQAGIQVAEFHAPSEFTPGGVNIAGISYWRDCPELP